MPLNFLMVAFFSYLLGTIPTALAVVYLFSRRDVRVGGSGNVGAMNTMRMLKKYKGLRIAFAGFLIVWIFDMLKAVAAIMLAEAWVGYNPIAYAIATGCVILGHNYPVLLKFKGGRGAASFMGILLYFTREGFFFWVLTVFAGMLLFELIELAIQQKPLTFRGVFHAISEQILGRLAGEIAAAYVVSLFHPDLLPSAIVGTALIIYSHRQRAAEQIARLKTLT